MHKRKANELDNDDDEEESFHFDNFQTSISTDGSASTSSKQSSASSKSPPSQNYSKASLKMMKIMGYEENRGLGVKGQGPTELIEESKQKGRRGLGFAYTGFEDSSTGWNFDEDPAIVHEEIVWCPTDGLPTYPLDIAKLKHWMITGPKKKTIDDETEFIEQEILQGVLSGKTIFDELPQKEMEEARARSNVYETIGQSIFLNRAAVKMANIDAMFNRIFTNPRTREGENLVLQDEPFYFADICAGPGGFSEYILWRRKWPSKGFGFTLRGDCDFKLKKFLVGSSEMFDPFYGVNGSRGDGDIFKLENIDALHEYVMKNTNNLGVHIVMADGGFSVDGQENIQEILSKQLYLCQFLTALTILRPNGNFVCKLFDLFTPFSVGLIYLMCCTFDEISIHKPVTSRPANSERYIICKQLGNKNREAVRKYMYEINRKLNEYSSQNSNTDIQSIVPLEILKGNEYFYNYIRDSNNRLGQVQIRNLTKIRAFVRNRSLVDSRQAEIRSECLKLWDVPNKPRERFQRIEQSNVYEELSAQLNLRIEELTFLKISTFNEKAESLFDYRCVLSLGDPIFLISCGGTAVFALELRNPSRGWRKIKDPYKIELPAYTWLLAEYIEGKLNDSRNNRPRNAIHVIDAYFIDNENLCSNSRSKVFTERFRQLKIFEKALNKPVRTDLVPIRVSEQFRLENMDEQLPQLQATEMFDSIDKEKLEFTYTENDDKIRVTVQGLWIFKFVQSPWTLLFGRSKGMKYFHNRETRESIPGAPADSSNIPSLRSMLENSFYWKFNDPTNHMLKSTFITAIKNKKEQMYNAKH